MMRTPTILPAWQALEELAQHPATLAHLLADGSRSVSLAHGLGPLLLDLTHQRIDAATLESLLALGLQAGLPEAARAMARGDRVNSTEQRPALHMALRSPPAAAGWQAPWPAEVTQAVLSERARMLTFADGLRSGQVQTPRGEVFTDLVNIGIGGSDLGPRMACAALSQSSLPSPQQPIRTHFISSPDPWALANLLAPLNPATTLFLVQSKTFTTQETRVLLAATQQWMAAQLLVSASEVLGWFAAVTAAPKVAQSLGFSADRLFGFWDWVGGRTSVWSSIGLPLAVQIGGTAFEDFLAGAHQLDRHFLETPVAQNLPMLLALTDCWNHNFLRQPTKAVVSYDWRLREFTRYLQQLEMESNGKQVESSGSDVATQTAPVIWGGLGIDGQHAYFQLLHQGTDPVPVDFLSVIHPMAGEAAAMPQAEALVQVCAENLAAQRTALALGRDPHETAAALRAEGLSESEVTRLTPHRCYAGNRPSSLISLEQLTPASLGMLIALYEHKVYCQSVVWQICAFDQWGVELGKTLVRRAQASH